MHGTHLKTTRTMVPWSPRSIWLNSIRVMLNTSTLATCTTCKRALSHQTAIRVEETGAVPHHSPHTTAYTTMRPSQEAECIIVHTLCAVEGSHLISNLDAPTAICRPAWFDLRKVQACFMGHSRSRTFQSYTRECYSAQQNKKCMSVHWNVMEGLGARSS